MKITSSSDNKYIGMEVPDIQIGDTIKLEYYTFTVQFRTILDDGGVRVGNPNYQIEISQEQ